LVNGSFTHRREHRDAHSSGIPGRSGSADPKGNRNVGERPE